MTKDTAKDFEERFRILSPISFATREDHYLTRRPWPDPRRGPWALILRWEEVGGRLQCVGLHLAASTEESGIPGAPLKPLTTTHLRQMNLHTEIEEARAVLALGLEYLGTTPYYDEESKSRFASDRGGLKGGRYPMDYWREVADIYTRAYRAGLPPTKAVQEQFRLKSRSTAKKHVQRARDEGFLPETDERKPKVWEDKP